MQVLYGRGYTKLESDQTGETSYSFSGLSGSLDHVLVNAAAHPVVNGRRHLGDQRHRVGGLPVQPVQLQRDRAVRGQQPVRLLRPQPRDRRHRHRSCAQIQILGINDFHGRIANNPTGDEAGAAVLAGAVKQMRAQNPGHGLRGGGRPDRRVDVRVVHPGGQADHRRPQRGRPRGLGRGQPRVRPGVRRPGEPGDGAVRRDHQPARRGRMGVHRRQRRSSRTTAPTRSTATWTQDFGDVDGRLRRRRDRAPPRAGVARAASRTSGHRHRARRPTRRPTTSRTDGADIVVLLVHEGAATTALRRPRSTRPRTSARSSNGVNSERRRDHLRPHAPGLQPRRPGAGVGRRGPCRSPSVRSSRPVSTA